MVRPGENGGSVRSRLQKNVAGVGFRCGTNTVRLSHHQAYRAEIDPLSYNRELFGTITLFHVIKVG